jgi:predicted phage tail protein
MDVQRPAWEAVDIILSTFRGSLIEAGNKYRLLVDQPSQPVQVFSGANIIRGNLQLAWPSLKERVNQVEVVFLDAEQDFKRESVRWPASVPQPLRTKSVQLWGVTRRSQALREARYLYNVVTMLGRTIEFDAGLEAVACEVGDIVAVSHDLPQWGYSGRIEAASVSGSNHVITIDRDDVPGFSGSTELLVRHDTGAIETRPVVSRSGREITCSAFSTLPTPRTAIWAYGPVQSTHKLWRIVKITLNSDLTRHIVGVEYDPAVYDESGLSKPARNPSVLPAPDKPPPSVVGLSVSVQPIQDQGQWHYRLMAHWNAPTFDPSRGLWAYASHYVSGDGGNSWTWAADADRSPVDLGVYPAGNYQVKAVSVSTAGVREAFGAAPTVSVSTTDAPPAAPSGLRVVRVFGRLVELEWLPNTDHDVSHYEVWRDTQPTFATEVRLAQVFATRYQDVDTSYGTTYYYRVRAVDHAGGVSAPSTGVSAQPQQLADVELASLAAEKLLAGSVVSVIGVGQRGAPALELDGIARAIVLRDLGGTVRIRLGRVG